MIYNPDRTLMRRIDAFPSSEAFDLINSALTFSDAERKEAIKQGNAVFAFTLKNKAGETESWHIDLKTKGEVAKGAGDNPTGKLLHGESRSDEFQEACLVARF
jgi:hypothetical protein